MSPSQIRPRWWQVYLTLPLLVALFAVDSRLKISTRGHQAVQIGIMILIYGLIHLWLKANAHALSKMDQYQHSTRITIVQVPWHAEEAEPTAFVLPDSEIKGVLSDTFEMDYIEAVSLPVGELSQESKKE